MNNAGLTSFFELETLLGISVGILMLTLFWRSRYVIKEGQRLKTFRLGRPLPDRGPGIHFIIPFIDRAEVAEIDRNILGWGSLTQAEISQMFPQPDPPPQAPQKSNSKVRKFDASRKSSSRKNRK